MQIFSYNEIKRVIILLLKPCADILPEKKHNRRIKDTCISEFVACLLDLKKMVKFRTFSRGEDYRCYYV